MAYILISGLLTKECLNTVMAIDNNKAHLEDYAKRYIKDNPGTQVHIFDWCAGFESMATVATERLWSSGYEPPISVGETSDPNQ